MRWNFRDVLVAAALAVWLPLTGTTAVCLSATPAFAQSANAKATVDSAKERGMVGEQGDGLLGFVMPSNDAALTAAVAEINAGRSQAYREAAARTGVTPDAAGQATAQQLLMRLPAGQYFKPLDGNWTRK
jgi:uncharacterized protein YdbL (DUF1318 family)